VVVTTGLTVIDAVVAPLLQANPTVQPLAVKVELWPAHINAFVVVITGTTAGVTVIFILEEPEQELVPHDAEYIVETAGVTVIVFPVAPVFQVRVEEQLLAVSITEVPAQTLFDKVVNVGP
jgi:hypothetical protein